MIYHISNKTLVYPKPLHIIFNKIGGFVETYDGTRYLILFDSEKYDAIYDRIRYVISLKSDITYLFFSLFCKKSKLILMILCL